MQRPLGDLAKIFAKISQGFSGDIEINEALVRESFMCEFRLADTSSPCQHGKTGSVFCQLPDSAQLGNLFFSIEKFHSNFSGKIVYQKIGLETTVSETTVSEPPSDRVPARADPPLARWEPARGHEA